MLEYRDYNGITLNGEAFLDELFPGWEVGIDLEVLDLSKGSCCIAGQITGCFSYPEARRFLGITPEQGHNLGFNLPFGHYDVDFDELTFSWVCLIQRKLVRREVAA